MTDELERFWQETLRRHPALAGRSWRTDYFGNPGQQAQELAGLIVCGEKKATCSLLEDDEPLPAPGMISLVLDGRERPVAAIETTHVSLRRFRDVDAVFAAAEGEDDKSLYSWRKAHREFFGNILEARGEAFRDDIWLVCEHFRLLYAEDKNAAPNGTA
ncbi:ASCH domain-containing protein [Enterobacillus tribolii]|uniref:Uncharacterized protein YhfF n=1 Tax=Enterobacillus tribolii TaxID=1487935 RepID=A0A370QHA9_9GAMM|nr:ASCH domain-containing protein [Enterobacillus tribolii]MBW7981798.1 ASCH domain-containing protein [Enterobacillus tribolii]RDK87480.1 uncharacterized protein YhfF [Enterobacillus tribolii]